MHTIEQLGEALGLGKITLARHMEAVERVFDNIQQLLVDEGVATGKMPHSEYADLITKWVKVLRTYPVNTGTRRDTKIFISSLLVTECWDRYLDRYTKAPKKMRFFDIYFEPAALRAAQSDTYVGDV